MFPPREACQWAGRVYDIKKKEQYVEQHKRDKWNIRDKRNKQGNKKKKQLTNSLQQPTSSWRKKRQNIENEWKT